jgi:hypothetical protein
MTLPPPKPWRTCTWQEFLNGAPPVFEAFLPRDEVVDQWFAQWASEFGKVSEEFIKYMTGVVHPEEETEELASKWSGYPSYHRECVFGDQSVHVVEADAGWTVQRATEFGDRLVDWRLLTHNLEIPVVFSSFPSAARLIETFFPDPPPPFIWNSREYL